MSLQHSNKQNSHNWIVGKEMSYVIIVPAAENLMLFSLCKIFFGRNCSTPRITVTSRHWFLQFYCRNPSENDVLFREISSNQKSFAMWKLFMCFTVNGWDITIKPVQNVQRPG